MSTFASQKGSKTLHTELLATQDYRSFLRIFFRRHELDPSLSKVSFSSFAVRAGYASKSYPAEILSGKKRLQVQSIDKFCNGMKLNRRLSEYFRNLVLMEVSNEKTSNSQSILNLKSRNKEIREKYLRAHSPLENQLRQSGQENILLQENFPEVYAALGSPERGASLLEISKRSGLKENEIEKILLSLDLAKVIKKIDGRFYLNSSTLDLKFLQSNEYFKKNFTRSTTKALKRMEKQVQDQQSLFMTQTFSVNSNKMKDLKLKLEETILSFADEAESAEGDSIAEICISFTKSH
jgi:hypothetical protein